MRVKNPDPHRDPHAETVGKDKKAPDGKICLPVRFLLLLTRLYNLSQDAAHSLGGLVLLLLRGVGVGAQGEPGIVVPRHGGHGFDVHAVLEGCGGEGVTEIRELEEEIPKHDDTDAILQKVAGGLIQVEYTYTPPYDYDRLGIPANFQKFRAAMGATRENTDAETFLFLKTDFLRQRNRLCGELDRIIEQIDYQLLKWNCNSIQK